MLTRLDNLTFDFVLAVIITDCLIGFFIWYEVFYRASDTGLETAVGVAAGFAISLAVTIVTFAHWELIRMISERYKRIRYEQGLEEGKKLGRKEARKEARERVEAFLSASGLELTSEDKRRLLGDEVEENPR